MIQVRPSKTIYHADGGWFAANWHFSFDRYYDPDNMGWGLLRVFNDDRLMPGAAWPMHPHRDIEGITYVAEGMFEHADSRGNGGVLPPGSVQRATLGSGMMHSERNHSKTEPMRFVQLWIMPARRGLEPSIEQRTFTEAERRNRLRPVLVPAPGYGGPKAPPADGAVPVHQDAAVYAGLLDPNATVTHQLRPGFLGYFFVVHGSAQVAGKPAQGGLVDEGGAARIADELELTITGGPRGAEVLLVEVPPA
jgi:redox-sensitive bicupin YhaK (pirin superfamily)